MTTKSNREKAERDTVSRKSRAGYDQMKENFEGKRLAGGNRELMAQNLLEAESYASP